MPELSERQQRILGYLRERHQAGLCPPTMREIKDACQFKSLNSVVYHLRAIAQHGDIELAHGVQARGIRLVPDAYDLELERIRAVWRSLPAEVRKELVFIAENDHKAILVHEGR